MNKFINTHPFMQSLFEDASTAKKAAEIGQAILAARSLRMSNIAAKMKGSSAASYKRTQRFVKQTDPREVLWRLFQEQSEWRHVLVNALVAFTTLVQPVVPTHV